MNSEEANILEDALAHLHTWTTGDLRFDEHLRPVRYVFAPDGRLVAPVMVAVLHAEETVIHVPVADQTAMELLVCMTEFEEDGPEGGLADRWRIYHGDPEDVRWATMTIDLARFHGMVIDGEGLEQANPLAGLEPALCGEVNREHLESLRSTLAAHLDIEAEDPRMVGLDPRGIDIRARFEVVRLPFDQVLDDPDSAREVVLGLLQGQ